MIYAVDNEGDIWKMRRYLKGRAYWYDRLSQAWSSGCTVTQRDAPYFRKTVKLYARLRGAGI